MNPLAFDFPGNSSPRVAKSRWRAWLALGTVLLLAGCGGGGGSTTSADSPLNEVVARQAAPDNATKAPAPLIAQPISLVNTNTAGAQAAQAIGATADGGYTVLWHTGQNLAMRHYDSEGHAVGPEIPLQSVPGSPGGSSPGVAPGAVAVLEDGSVVLAYASIRSSGAENAPIVTTVGLYLQRFGPDGAQIVPETEISSFVEGDPRRPSYYDTVQLLAMPGGGYLLGWGTFTTSATVGFLTSFSTLYFDSHDQRAGAPVVLDTLGAHNVYARIVADGLGGYTVYWSGVRRDFTPTGLNVAHFSQTQASLQVLSGWAGSALLLPLEDGRYVLYTSDAAGSVAGVFLDSSGAPQGPASALPVMPVLATLLADGTYVEAWPASTGGLAAQRFDIQGMPIGDVLALPADATQRRLMAALADGGFATASSAIGSAGDLDVYTQAFVEPPTRKSCLAAARGMRGQVRKAFMAGCLPGKQWQHPTNGPLR